MNRIQWHIAPVSSELDTETRKKLKGKPLSTLIKKLVAEWLGRPDLAKPATIGRPRNQLG